MFGTRLLYGRCVARASSVGKVSARWLHFRGGHTSLIMVRVTRFALLLSDLPGGDSTGCVQRIVTPLRDRAASHPTVFTLPALRRRDLVRKSRGCRFVEV